MTKFAQTSLSSRRFSTARSLSFSLAALSALCSMSVFSEQTDKERIKSLEQRLLELEQQVQKKNEHSSTTVRDAQNESTNSKKVVVIPKTTQRPSHDFEAPDKSIVLSNSDTTLQIGGQIWLDAIYIPVPLEDARFRNSERFIIKAHFFIKGYSLKKKCNAEYDLLSLPQGLV